MFQFYLFYFIFLLRILLHSFLSYPPFIIHRYAHRDFCRHNLPSWIITTYYHLLFSLFSFYINCIVIPAFGWSSEFISLYILSYTIYP